MSAWRWRCDSIIVFYFPRPRWAGAPSRLELNKADKEFGRIKNTIHRPRLRRISDTTIDDAIRRGIFPPIPTIKRGSWMLPISPTTDAGYSADENIDNLRAGLESPQELVAETNRNWSDVVRAKKQAAIDVARAVEDANRELVAAGYKPTVTAMEISQLSDNPQQAAAAGTSTRKSYDRKSRGSKLCDWGSHAKSGMRISPQRTEIAKMRLDSARHLLQKELAGDLAGVTANRICKRWNLGGVNPASGCSK